MSEPRRRAHSAARAAIVAGTFVVVVVVVLVGLNTPGYRPWADAVSRLGSRDEPHAVFLRSAFVAYGLLVVAGRRAVGRDVAGRNGRIAVLVAVYGAAAVVAGLAPKDPPKAPHTFASQLHVAATIVGGAALLVAIAIVARFAADRKERRVAIAVGVVTTLVVVVFPFTWGSSVYGIVEILILASGMGWLVAEAAR